MQKHQNWLQNKNYEHHLRCLQDIRGQTRRIVVQTALSSRRNKKNNSMSNEDKKIHDLKQNRNTGETRECLDETKMDKTKVRMDKKSKALISVKERELLWNNFLLGKRILETSSVLNLRKNEADYRKHKKILDARTMRTKKQKVNDQFRNSKLQEFNCLNQKISNCIRIPSSTISRQIIELNIKNLRLKQKLGLQNITLKYYVSKDLNESQRHNSQSSEIIDIGFLMNYTFYFRLPSHHLRRLRLKENQESKTFLNFSLFQVKGLNELLIGQFVLEELEVTKQYKYKIIDLHKFGKPVGEIELQFCCVSKRDLIENFVERND